MSTLCVREQINARSVRRGWGGVGDRGPHGVGKNNMGWGGVGEMNGSWWVGVRVMLCVWRKVGGGGVCNG